MGFYLGKVKYSGRRLFFCFVLAQHVAQWGSSPQRESQSAVANQSDKMINTPKLAVGVTSLIQFVSPALTQAVKSD